MPSRRAVLRVEAIQGGFVELTMTEDAERLLVRRGGVAAIDFIPPIS